MEEAGLSGLRLKSGNRAKRSRKRRKSSRSGARLSLPSVRLPDVEWSPKRVGMGVSVVVLVFVMVLAVSSALGWGRDGERFLLTRFEVRGSAVLTEEEVIELTGVELGSSLLDIRISDLEEALVASPRIVRAQALRVLPDRVVVTLDEKRPSALILADGGSVLEIMDDGEVLPPVVRSSQVDLPVLTGAAVEPGMGELPEGVECALEALRLARGVSEGLWAEISEIRIAPESGLVIYTVADGAEIRVGSGALDERDLTRLWMVLSDIRARGDEIESIDMRFKDQVVVKLS
jgi:cell division protein FtsQ